MKKVNIILLFLAAAAFSHHSAKAQLDYKDVAHIFYNNCTSCHHQNGGAPMPLMSYSQTLPYASSIEYKLQNGLMPPWSPDTSYTRFVHERVITAAEKNAILLWISGGSTKGDTTLAPPPPVYSSQYKLIGTPDLILTTPLFTSNASSDDSYVCFSIPSTLTQDRVLRAYEIVPSNPAIFHHGVVKIDTMGTSVSDLSGACFTSPGDFGIGAFAPGAAPFIFTGQAPLKMGIRIKLGSNITLQQHLPAGSIGDTITTQIRMYFYPIGETGIRPVYNSEDLANWNMNIPPNAVTTLTAMYPLGSATLPVPVSIFSTFPHSHKVCRSIVNYAYKTSPADTVKLIRINNWDFMWQGYYTFPNLVKIPAGYKLFAEHVFDNTINNPNNPNNPPALVVAGTSTFDEMLLDEFMWLRYETGDELIDIEALLTNDPLLNTVSVNEISSPPAVQAFLYPNPASNKLSVYLSKKSEYKACILSITGQTILQAETFSDNTTIDVNSIPPGLYIVEVTDFKTNLRITKKVVITN